MASSRNSDVNLVIRAKNEADQAIHAVSGALESLLGDAKHASGGVAELGQTLATLDRTFAAVSGKADQAGAAFERQQSAIAGNRAELTALRDQADAAGRAAETLRSRIVDEVLAGRDQSPVIAQIKQVEQEQASLAARADKLTRTIATQEAALNGSRSSLLQLGATVHAVEDAQAEAAARIALTTQALNEQAAAAQHVTAMQQRINDVTGVNRPAATGSAAAAASVLLEADNIFRRTEARTAEIQKLREQEAATAALADAEGAEQANRTRFNITDDPRGTQARASAAVFIAAADAEDQMAREAAHLRAQLDPLAAIQDRFNASLARYRELAAAGKIGTDDLARAEQHLATEAEQARMALERNGRAGAGAKPSLFGLKPYELQNLGYQVNDIATQLASGTSLTQTLGQQGGQILQLFPRVTSAIVGAFSNPAFLGAATVLGGIIFGLKKAGDQAERLREFSAALSFRADGGGYDAGTLVKQAEALERLGASAKDADAAVTAMLDGAVARDAMQGLGRAAQETAERLGQSLPDAVKAASEAFTGGYDAVARFDDRLHFLTASEREHIRTLFESGNAEAARTEARLAYQRMEDSIAAKARGPWAEATLSLERAWKSLMHWIADSAPIRAAIFVMNELAAAVKSVGDAVTSATGSAPAQTPDAQRAKRLSETQAQIKALEADIARYNADIAKGIANPAVENAARKIVENATAQLAKARAELARLEKDAPDTINDDPNGARAKQRAEELGRISREEELQRLRDAGQTRLLSAAERARRLELAGLDAAKGASDSVVAAAEKRRAAAKETAAIEREAEVRAKAAAAEARRLATPREQAKLIIRDAEGFRSKAYTDSDGRPRVGYGSDTLTRADGSIGSASKGSTVDREGAECDLDRRVGDVFEYLKTKLGDRLEKFTSTQQGVLASIVYNYGKLPDSILKALRFGTNEEIAASIRARGEDRAHNLGPGANRGRRSKEADLFGNAARVLGEETPAIDADNENNADELLRRQNALNEAVEKEASQHQGVIDALTAEQGLRDTALLTEQRRQAVLAAERDLLQERDDANKNLKPGETPVVVTPEQIARTKELAAALFDAQHAQDLLNAEINEAQRPLDLYRDQAELLRQQADYLRSIGDFQGANQLEDKLGEVNTKIRLATQNLIEVYVAIGPALVAAGVLTQGQLDQTIAKLKVAKTQTQEWGKIAGVSSKDIAQAFASGAVTAFTNFINKVAAGKNVFKALGQSVREFAANFIAAVAQMILQLLAYAAAVAILRAFGVPVPGSVGVSLKHTGGIAGQADGNGRRMIDPAIFAAALRYHNGGIAGIKPNEVAAVLEVGEEVLTTSNPRHIANAGKGGGGRGESQAPVHIANFFDREQAAEYLLRTRAGERAILNMIRDNQASFRAALS